MTKDEVLERSRQELQGRTISEEDVKIHKERFTLSEEQGKIRSFYWGWLGFLVGIGLLSWLNLSRGKDICDLSFLLFFTLTSLYLARGIYRKAKLDFVIAAGLGTMAILQGCRLLGLW